MLSNTSSDFISDIGVTYHRQYDREKLCKIDNLQPQECSLKNRCFWKLVISLKTYMKERQ